MYEKLREILTDFYINQLTPQAEQIRERVFSSMDEYAENHPEKTSYQLKAKLYETIADAVTPTVFEDLPFYFETGALVPFCDGKFNRGGIHANGWLYLRNSHLYSDMDPHAYEVRTVNSGHLYTQTGIYSDMMHVGLPMKKVFRVGLSGILDELKEAEGRCTTEKEKDFVLCATAGISALCKIEKKLALEARKKGLHQLAEMAEWVPLYPPQTVHEGLCTLAFMRKALGALEGMGFNSFGRVDVLLAPLYETDRQRGVSDEALLDLISRFLLIWDCALDRRKPMTNYSEYELENTLTLGGCDGEGNPVFNGITRLFLKARSDLDALYPKMMLRYSASSPEEYLKLISEPLLQGKSFSLFENDDSIIPALIDSGIEKEDAMNYVVGGCWDSLTPDVSNRFSGEYLSMTRPLELSVYQLHEEMVKNELYFESLEEVQSFDELYARYLGFLRRVLIKKADPMSRCSRIWDQVNPVGALSALMEPCIPKLTDLTAGGGKYNRECVYFTGFAEVADSLLAIKILCFDQKHCTVKELFDHCRNNWPDEVFRQRVIGLPSYGDGSEESSRFAGKFLDDLSRISKGLPTAYGGEFRIGYNLYTEIIYWGQQTKALPNGRRDGDYLSQGLSPSRLQRPVTVFDVLDSLRYADMKKCNGNSSVSVTLPAAKLDSDRMVEFFRIAARSGIQGLQPNCVNREDLLAAQKEPEKYQHIIVRVCGFSAPFVQLAPHFQEEFLSRMLMEV